MHDADRRDARDRRDRARASPPCVRAVSCCLHLGLRVGRGLAGHVELHADLVQLERRQLARHRRSGLAVQHVDVLVERLARRHRDRVPEVVCVVALVVVAHARVLVDDAPRRRRCASGSTLAATSADVYPSARVSKIAESWRSTPASLTRCDALADLGLGDAEPLAEHRVRRGVEREVPLHRVQELAVEVVESWASPGSGRRTQWSRRAASSGAPCSRG